MTSRVLITGGSGFIGTNLVAHYANTGCELLNLDGLPPRNRQQAEYWRQVDIRNRQLISKAIYDFSPTTIFHLAARTDLHGETLSDYSTNIEGLANVIRAVRTCRGTPPLAVFASSMLVCRIGYRPTGERDYCPPLPYGASKVVGEELVRNEAAGYFPWVIVRPTSIWGPWFGSPYRDFFELIANGRYVHPRGKRIRRSYGYVGNTVFQLSRIAAVGGGILLSRTAYLADYDPIELRGWANMIQKRLNAPPIREAPLPLLRGFAKFGDLMKYLGYRNPPLTSFRLNNLLTEAIQDTAALREVCGDTPHTMIEGVRITCDWLQSRRH